MRLFYTVLFLLVPIVGVWTFAIADDYGWWFPENISSFGGEIDRLFDVIMYMVGFTFIATEVLLAWCILRYSDKSPGKADFSHGNHKLELLWTAVPALALLFIAFSQMGTWADIKYAGSFPDSEYSIDRPMAQVYASQFDWRVRYPDEEGNFEGTDVIESAFDFVVPVDTDVVFRLRSRDVLHSFFVPQLRLKQDAVPGMDIPVWFRAEKTGEYDIICAELCGWGHYKMAGRLRVLEPDDYDSWLAEQRVALYTNGTEDREDV